MQVIRRARQTAAAGALPALAMAIRHARGIALASVLTGGLGWTPGCNGSSTSPSSAGKGSAVAPMPSTPAAPPRPAADATPIDVAPLRVAEHGRVIAFGDVHGDLAATRAALRTGGVIDDADRWIGGTTVVVQTGDQLDRGDEEEAILELLERLREEATKAGGALVVLNGNHEIMNALGDFRYVTEAGMIDFDGRAAVFAPGGAWARKLATRHVVAVVGDTVFAHGGIEPEQVAGLVDLDADVRAWLSAAPGDHGDVPSRIMDEHGPVWSRELAGPDDPAMCERLGRTLAALGTKRMVVGHTVQKGGISSACDARVWRIDVGLAQHYGGPTEVLEIRGDDVRVLRPG